MSDDKKIPSLISPRGHAAHAWLTKADTKYNSEGVYKVDLLFPKGDVPPGRIEWGNKELPGDKWLKYIQQLCKQHGVSYKPGEEGCPIKDGDTMKDKEGNQKPAFEGTWFLRLKSKYKPSLIDTKGNELPKSVPVYSGDLIKAAFNMVPKTVKGTTYMSMYLSKVMLIQKLSGGDGISADAFGEDEGYVVEDTADTEDLDDDESGDF